VFFSLTDTGSGLFMRSPLMRRSKIVFKNYDCGLL
jgi:hypothetical protein